jgi:tetratricopeptide (TPR) repeat protein
LHGRSRLNEDGQIGSQPQAAGRDAGHLAHPYVRAGELYEQRGERERAIDYYQRLVDLWQNADPDLQSRVEEVRKRMARLAGEPRGS